jgi:hypothetical protein
MSRHFPVVAPILALGFSLLCACSGGDAFQAAVGGSAGIPAAGGGGKATDGGGASGTSGSGGAGGNAGTPGGGAAGVAGASGMAGAAGAPVTGPSPNGAVCGASGECASGYCVDGVCCDSACDGPCLSCQGIGDDGTCKPSSAGADPDGDCAGSGPPGNACQGACDGAGACAFPNANASCGASSCSNGQQTDHYCDGAGSCTDKTDSCGYFVCGQVSCLNACSSDADCTPDAFCNAGNCQPKQDNGVTCTSSNACKSGMCAMGFCCNAVCSPPFSCSTGTCKCGNQVCGFQEACITWYADNDKDGYGDPNNSMLGCADTAPAPNTVKNKTDCYDSNANAHPGQTAFFTTSRGDGSFDYDCSSSSEIQYPNVGGKSCGRCFAPFGTSCLMVGCAGGWGCNGTCPSTGPAAGFVGNVACGQSGVLNTCGDNPNTTTCDPIDQTANVLQGCH